MEPPGRLELPSPVYKTGILPLNYRGVAGALGLEPRFAGSKPAVLAVERHPNIG